MNKMSPGRTPRSGCSHQSPRVKRSPASQKARALEFLESRIDFERSLPTDHAELGAKLDAMRRLLKRLGDPQRSYPTIHVAGTKGKGSVCEMLDRVLRAAGYRTGRFTSPHLYSFTERIALDGAPCPLKRCTDALLFLKKRFDGNSESAADAASLTYFELLTVLAMFLFGEEKVDVAIFEVGLGGRFDATNVCEPTIDVITSIGFDHTELLGETLGQIASEKAGIIKPGVPVVSGVRLPEPEETIRRIAAEKGAVLSRIDHDFHLLIENGAGTYVESPSKGRSNREPQKKSAKRKKRADVELRGIRPGMAGEHQFRNAAVAVRTIRLLGERGFSVSDDALRAGLEKAHLPLRIERICDDPVLIVDGAHNRTSAEALVATLRSISVSGRRFLLFGAMLGKDIEGMLSVLLPAFDEALFTRCTTNPRAFPAVGLATVASTIRNLDQAIPSLDDLKMRAVADPHEAIRDLWNRARPGDLICATGSLYLVAEVRRAYLENLAERSPDFQEISLDNHPQAG